MTHTTVRLHGRDAARGLGALLVLTALVVGVPVALLAFGADPRVAVPRQWPSQLWPAIRWGWLDGSLIRGLVIATAWIGWLVLASMILMEAVCQIRHGAALARDRLANIPRRRWIAGLVAATVILISAGTASAMPATGSQIVATATHDPPRQSHPTSGLGATSATHQPISNRSRVDPSVRPDCPRIEVHEGDTMWGLAEYHLGDGRRYVDIENLNAERIPRTGQLRPTDVLLLPGDAVNLPTAQDETATGRKTVTVEPGDTLASIAEHELGDPDAWRNLFDANRARAQPDGRVLRSPNLLRPGWRLLLPAETTVRPPAAPPSSQTTEAPRTPPDRGNGETSQPPQPSRSPGSNPTEVTPLPQQLPLATAVDPGTSISVATGAFVGIGLAALITLALVTVRLRRRRQYCPGERETRDSSATPIVRALRIAHDTTTAATLNGDKSEPVNLVFDRGFLPELIMHDRALSTARDVTPDSGETVVGVRDGDAVLLDLAHIHGLGLTGPGSRAAARALIVALLAAKDEQGADVIVPSATAQALFGDSQLRQRPASLQIVDDLSTALDILEAELLARNRHGDVGATMSNRSAVEARPLVLVATPTADTETRLRAILDTGSEVALAGILLDDDHTDVTAHVQNDGTVSSTSPVLAGATLFTLPASDGNDLLALLRDADATAPGAIQEFTPLGPDATALADDPSTSPNVSEFVVDVLERVISAEQDDANDEPPAETCSALGDESPNPSGEPSTAADASPRPALTLRSASELDETAKHPMLTLQVLGRLHLRSNGDEQVDVIGALAPRQKEILVHLALHRDGVRRETLTATLWPDAPADRPYNGFHATLSQLRRALRKAVGDEASNITTNDDGHYRLNNALVDVDLWALINALTAGRRAPTLQARTAALKEAADLYPGGLAEGITAEWIDAPREALRHDVLNAMSALIGSLGQDNPEQSLLLLEQARAIDPYNEAIYRDLMRNHARLSQYDAVSRTLVLLTSTLAELGQRPSSNTLHLAEVLQRAAGTQSQSKEAS